MSTLHGYVGYRQLVSLQRSKGLVISYEISLRYLIRNDKFKKKTYFDDDDDNDFCSLVVELLSMLRFAGN